MSGVAATVNSSHDFDMDSGSSIGMVDAANGAGPYCTACFSGDYPAPLVDVEKGLASPEGPRRC